MTQPKHYRLGSRSHITWLFGATIAQVAKAEGPTAGWGPLEPQERSTGKSFGLALSLSCWVNAPPLQSFPISEDRAKFALVVPVFTYLGCWASHTVPGLLGKRCGIHQPQTASEAISSLNGRFREPGEGRTQCA
jgi:hypothetical protein